MIEQAVEEWREEAVERFGSFPETRFVCPACGHITTVQDFRQFKDKGATPDTAAKNCIGRFDRSITDCDWCAYGLFRTVGRGRKLTLEDGKSVEVFDFDLTDGERKLLEIWTTVSSAAENWNVTTDEARDRLERHVELGQLERHDAAGCPVRYRLAQEGTDGTSPTG